MIRAAQVRALWTEGRNVSVIVLHYPCGAFFVGHLPAVYAGAAENHLHRRIDRKTGHIANLHPLLLLAGFGREKEVAQSGDSERGGDRSPQAINGADVEAAPCG